MLLLVLAAAARITLLYSESRPEAGAAPQAVKKPTVGNPASEAEFAWSLFIEAMKPAGSTALTFETWTEQCELNPKMAGCPAPPPPAAAGAKVRRLHSSALARKLVGAKATVVIQGAECSPMNTQGFSNPNYPAPANVLASATFCEEVYVNPAEANFVRANKLTTLSGQQAYGNAHAGAITFPWEAVELKVDWVPTSSFSPTFECPDPTNKLYTENINGTCYAMVGVHIISKVLPNWVWATFEPASSITNPNRCDPALYNACYDPWGTTSQKPYGRGQTVSQSPALANAMASANLNKAFNNYFLTKVQTRFSDNLGNPTQLGNSFVEFNASVAPGQASCITCHKYAYFNGVLTGPGIPPEQNFGGPLGPTSFPAWPSVGNACSANPNANCLPPSGTSGWIAQDFSWMMGLFPPD
jgi:hypothetical protein